MSFISIMPTDKSPQVSIEFSQEIEPTFNMEAINKMLNKTVVVEYEEAPIRQFLDIIIDGKATLNYSGLILADAIKYTGVLSAPTASADNTTNDIELKTTDGQVLVFNHYISPTIVAANGKTVDIIALTTTQQNLKKISVK
jgi:hypothetical protein